MSAIVNAGLFLGCAALVDQQQKGWPWWAWLLLILALAVIVLLLWWLWRGSRRKEVPAAPPVAPAVRTAPPPPPAAPAVTAPAPVAPAVELPPPVVTRAPAAPAQPDDLKIVEGIGPKIASILQAAGITTFAQLAGADVGLLRQILQAAGLQHLADPGSWPAQARLAAEGQWDALQALQDSLKGGRRTE